MKWFHTQNKFQIVETLMYLYKSQKDVYEGKNKKKDMYLKRFRKMFWILRPTERALCLLSVEITQAILYPILLKLILI